MTEHRPPGSFSPELALVDPVAAEQVRSELPEVVLTEDAALSRRADDPPVAKRRIPWMLACLAALSVVGVLLGLRLASGGSDGTSTLPPPATARAIPDFVWVPAPNANRYRIEFIRNGRVVLQRTTTVARLRIAASTLPPGSYRWRVWALGAGGARLGAALVDAAVRVA